MLKDILSMYKTCESNKGTIFRMYKGFLTKKNQNMWSTDSIKNKWEKERDWDNKEGMAQLLWTTIEMSLLTHIEGVCMEMFKEVLT